MVLLLALAACGDKDKAIYMAEPGCDGVGDVCLDGVCCAGMFCQEEACCIAPSFGCDSSQDCCSGSCLNGACTPLGPGLCSSSADCETGLICQVVTGVCEAPVGAPCSCDGDGPTGCVAGSCEGTYDDAGACNGICLCGSDGSPCASDGDCCNGLKCAWSLSSESPGNKCQ
jgi:hypothetical protein